MNKKGFTLIELLAVIVMIIIIVGLSAPTLINVIKSNKEKANEKIIEIIESAARSYVIDYGKPNSNIVCIEELCNKKYLTCPVIDSKNELMEGCIIINNNIENIEVYNYINDTSTYTIDYILNGGVVSNPGTYSANKGLILSNPTKENYTFLGWTGSNGNTPQKDIIINPGSEGNKEYTANWSANTYTITYNCNGGSGTMPNLQYTVDNPTNLTSNACHKITSGVSGKIYYLKGWAKTSTATEVLFDNEENITNSTDITGNTELYAVWDELFVATGYYEVINDSEGDWRVKFYGASTATRYGSQTITFNTNTTIDIFLVGGGAAGGGGDAGGSGGSGYTRTVTNFGVSNSLYSIAVGKGGSGVNSYYQEYQSASGGETSFYTLKAGGGIGGIYSQNFSNAIGGNGGTGGAGRDGYFTYTYSVNGADGPANQATRGGYGQISHPGPNGETGNTYEFGNTNSTLYANGGRWSYNARDNYGDGGGSMWNGTGGNGGSGIVIIRNHR